MVGGLLECFMNNMAIPYEVREKIGKRKKRIGALGEALVVKHLKNKGFKHLESNFLLRQGELDVIMEYEGVIHFIEVKTVSHEIKPQNMANNRESGTRETHPAQFFRPEENVHTSKLRKIAKVIRIYLERKGLQDKDWVFDVAAVYLDQKKQKAYIRLIKDVLIENS